MSRRMSDYGDFRSIVVDSGPLNLEGIYSYTTEIPYCDIGEVTFYFPPPIPDILDTMDKKRVDGLRDDQWDWIKDKGESQDHVFFFTHGRIVGGGEEQRGRMVDHTEDFVEWANQDDVNVHAVFNGHWHRNNEYGVDPFDPDTPDRITVADMDDPDDLPTNIVPFTWNTVYIETENST